MFFGNSVVLNVDVAAAKRLNIISSKTLKDFKTFGVLYFSVV